MKARLRVDTYTEDKKHLWDAFVSASNHDSFLFLRDFMEYHADRFKDASLMVFKNDQLMALLPLHYSDGIAISHNGLTYGGFIFKSDAKFGLIKDILTTTLAFLNDNGIPILKLKMLPRIYQHQNEDALDYLMYLLNANTYRSELLAVVHPKDRNYARDRMAGYKRGVKNGLIVKEVQDLKPFWEKLLVPNLKAKHGVLPVHNAEEISKLKQQFPQSIRQFNVYLNDELVAGTTIFETTNVAHSQYIAGNPQKNELGSLDFLHIHLLEEVFSKKPYFDFGISSINDGRLLNEGLLYWKQGFGAKGYLQNFYEIETKNYKLLNEVFI
jgi:hypothetical protein